MKNTKTLTWFIITDKTTNETVRVCVSEQETIDFITENGNNYNVAPTAVNCAPTRNPKMPKRPTYRG